MSETFREIAHKSIGIHEGLRLKVYRCTASKRTIGKGRNLDAKGISQVMADRWRDEDIAAGRHVSEQCYLKPTKAKAPDLLSANYRKVLIIGYGLRMQNLRITEADADEMLNEDMVDAVADAQTWCDYNDEGGEAWQTGHQVWRAMNEVRKAVIVEIAFNIGLTSFLKFGETRRLIQIAGRKYPHQTKMDPRYVKAGFEMLDSKWARKDVPRRALTLARRMGTGVME